ncbi:hypothetical protein [Kribbella qitaiheensis]|uniref:hypothetical protein n=1 Tax=Kribbella qitaiheensis TaxID=1544730 RepID=UPI0016240A27|nr:hypothetical protein [Kribbella qitaiheensis]
MGALDACVLIPAGLRDLLLSCANEAVFRPVWQDEILDEVRRELDPSPGGAVIW